MRWIQKRAGLPQTMRHQKRETTKDTKYTKSSCRASHRRVHHERSQGGSMAAAAQHHAVDATFPQIVRLNTKYTKGSCRAHLAFGRCARRWLSSPTERPGVEASAPYPVVAIASVRGRLRGSGASAEHLHHRARAVVQEALADLAPDLPGDLELQAGQFVLQIVEAHEHFER
jgi:hypothetical protein